jgi:ABC-2 type transport system permease protein
LWRSFYNGSSSSALLVPILIIAAGQLAGSLAWLAISGEDAPDLIASAPVTTACAVRAKIEAVMGVIAVIFGPFVVALLFIAPISALIAGLGVAGAAASATSIQFWFRAQAKRSQLRRRHTSSLTATFAEALSSFSWAGAGALAPASTWLALIEGLFALAIVAGAWAISPARHRTRCSGGSQQHRAKRIEVFEAGYR